MSRLLVAIALFGATFLSVPAFAAQDCLAYCQERCGSKGNYCKIKCNEKCQQRNSSSTHTTCQLLLIIHPWRGCRPAGRSLANREKFHAATTIDNRCNRFGGGFGSRVCL